MTYRRALWGLLLLPAVARAELADALALEVARNPALAAIAARDGAAARAIAADAARRLNEPAGMARSAETPDAEEAALLRDNPLLGAVFRHDPAAALDLLTRVKQAGGTRR